MNTPTVTMAAEKHRLADERPHGDALGDRTDPGHHDHRREHPGGERHPEPMTNHDVKYAPRIISAGWAKLTTSVAR